MRERLKEICSYLIDKDDLIIEDKIRDELAKEGVSAQVCKKVECQIRVYSKDKIPISTIIPILSNFGFTTISEITFEIDDIFVTKLKINAKSDGLLVKHEDNLKRVLIDALLGKIDSSKIFELVYLENFSPRDIFVTRAVMTYSAYLIADFSLNQIESCLISHPFIARAFLNLFYIKFDPTIQDRDIKIDMAIESIKKSFKEVEDINDDRVLKLIFRVISSIVRTNLFLNRDDISLKIELSGLKEYIKGVQPQHEIYIYAKDFRGVHLRTSLVARGGIRWSKRADFRDEIRALMAAQEAKNSIIVPTGAKGGFIIRKEHITYDEFKNIYERFISSLLDLVDNKVEDKIVKNREIVSYDRDDPYFVVAADRGTSNLSDKANEISKSRGFWIGDAFASGGSNGYHHKKLGITAKGALRSADRFFKEVGRDLYSDIVSIVGVGSMSGDVFGNGMLESQNFKLIAAISHDEIFVDPTPDLREAFLERRRLFFDKNSKWSNYDKDKISEGGGVYKRNSKSIVLTPQIKALLHTDREVLSGEELARELLKMRVDMLYFGGVGTYVKSSEESSESIGDKENEFVRVDANELKAFCICEGANLAISMRARIEYALNGGRVSLDSIDNAAGVNTSDHEVNFKIVLNRALEKGKIDEKRRVEHLHRVSDFVVESVLKTNEDQASALSKDEKRSRSGLKKFKKSIAVLEANMQNFKRAFFNIPKDHNFTEVVDDNSTLVRPVIATLLLYSKIFMQRVLNESDLLSDISLQEFLFSYFPPSWRDEFKEEISMHPLRREIIAMIIANIVINREGVTYISDFRRDERDSFLKKIKSSIDSYR
jgi:glutamate dehydrogenase